MNMQEIKLQFNGVANDFIQVKKKMKFQEMLLMIAISIGILNFLCFFYFRPSLNQLEKEVLEQNKETTIINNLNQTIDELNAKIISLEKKGSAESQVTTINNKDEPTHKTINYPTVTRTKKENDITKSKGNKDSTITKSKIDRDSSSEKSNITGDSSATISKITKDSLHESDKKK